MADEPETFYTVNFNGSVRVEENNRLYFGGTSCSEADVSLYRLGEDVLHTPDTFRAGGYQSSDGSEGITKTLIICDYRLEVKNGLITGCSSINDYGYLLMETGNRILLETGDGYILLEGDFCHLLAENGDQLLLESGDYILMEV